MGRLWAVLTSNYVINVSFLSWFLAQVTKTLLVLLVEHKLKLERMVGAGGMPSCHSAFVCALTVAMAKVQGFSSPLFALTLAFAAIVMYDAMGVRRAAGEQAKVINKMIFSFKDINKIFGMIGKEIEEAFNDELENNNDSIEDIAEHKTMKEYLGHTPLEVLGGALLGILVASLMPYS